MYSKLIHIWLLISIASCFVTKAQAQIATNELTLMLGNSQGVVKDEVFSPLNYQSNGGTIGINYQRNTKNGNLFLAEMDLKTLEIETDVSRFFLAEQVQLNMEVGYLFKISKHSRKNRTLFVGFDVHSNGNLINYEDEITLSNSGTFVSHRGLGFQALQQIKYKKNEIDFHLKLPVIGKVYRSPYNVFTKNMNDEQIFTFLYTNGEFGALHNYFNPSLRASISRPLLGRLHFSLGYELDYLKSSVNKTITSFQGRLLFATTFKF